MIPLVNLALGKFSCTEQYCTVTASVMSCRICFLSEKHGYDLQAILEYVYLCIVCSLLVKIL